MESKWNSITKFCFINVCKRMKQTSLCNAKRFLECAIKPSIKMSNSCKVSHMRSFQEVRISARRSLPLPVNISLMNNSSWNKSSVLSMFQPEILLVEVFNLEESIEIDRIFSIWQCIKYKALQQNIFFPPSHECSNNTHTTLFAWHFGKFSETTRQYTASLTNWLVGQLDKV